jgi:hypothetical protein
MKKNISDIAKKVVDDLDQKKITRKQAIKKTGLIAVSAASMMMLLGSNAQAASPGITPPPGGW